MTVTWNPTDKGAAIILSGSNLTTRSTAAGSVRATEAKTSGKWYWEVIPASISGDLVVGIEDATANLANYPGSDSGGWGLLSSNGSYHGGGPVDTTVLSYGASSVVSILLDMDAHTLSFRINGGYGSGLLSGLPGSVFAAIGYVSSSSGGLATANFGDSPFSQRIPEGFAAYGNPALVGVPIPAFTCAAAIPLVQLGSPPITLRTPTTVTLLHDMNFGGPGTITGTVKEAGTPDAPVVRRVRLHRKIDGLLVRETWSAADGSYRFDRILIQPYYVVSFDHLGNFNAVIKDSIVPEVP